MFDADEWTRAVNRPESHFKRDGCAILYQRHLSHGEQTLRGMSGMNECKEGR